MKAKAYFGDKYDKSADILSAAKTFKRRCEDIDIEEKHHEAVDAIEFSCEIQVWICATSIEFYPPIGGWPSEEIHRNALTEIRRALGVGKLTREFDTSSGAYKWVGKRADGVRITVNAALPPSECEVVEEIVTVTKYRSVCGNQDNGGGA